MHLNFVQAQPAAPVFTAQNRKTRFLLWAELILTRCDSRLAVVGVSLQWRWWDVPDLKASGEGGSVREQSELQRASVRLQQVVLHIRTLLLHGNGIGCRGL